MELEIKHNSKYKELIVIDTNVKIETGLLDEKEAKQLALELIEAAVLLMS